MAVENEYELLIRYRRDRRLLLEFVLSSDLIKKRVMPPDVGSLDDIDLDKVDVDYVINCAKKGDVLVISKAISNYQDDTVEVLHRSSLASANDFSLVTDSEAFGSPPRRPPPSVPHLTSSSSIQKTVSNSSEGKDLSVDEAEDLEDENDLEEPNSSRTIPKSVPSDASDIALQFPPFKSGITDDDLRETAYEVLLACVGATGGLTMPSKQTKKPRKSKFLRKLGRGKSEIHSSQSQRASGLSSLLETMRTQMEISEAMDTRSRQGLLNVLQENPGKRLDTLLIPLELLCCISPAEFDSKKRYIRWQKRQLNMLEEGILNHPKVSLEELADKAGEMRNLLAKIEECEVAPPSNGEVQRSEYLASLRDVAIPLAKRQECDELAGEVSHWANGYHLNVRLYEKLLRSVFDVLDEGKFAKEMEEILELLKSTWHVLGVTQIIHHTAYARVLFHQFLTTNGKEMLTHVAEELKRIPLKDKCEVGPLNISFLEAVLTPIHTWADIQLTSYHTNFAEDLKMMEDVVSIAMVSRRLLQNELVMQSEQDQIEFYISTSIKNAFSRAFETVDTISNEVNEHPLLTLAEEMKKLLRNEATSYDPILSQWHPNATVVSLSLIHNLYGVKLKPFLFGVENLSADVVSVLAAAYSLEQYTMSFLTSTYGEDVACTYFEQFASYEIKASCGPLVVRWVDSQLERLLAWVERAIQQENWDPITPQQRHGRSIIEVLRIVEETVDQFFELGIPMGSEEVNSLICGINNVFQVYANQIIANLANREEMIPPTLPLTRYRKGTGFKALIKKERSDRKMSEKIKSKDIKVLATPTLSVQLNTLHYAVTHLTSFQENMSNQWLKKKSSEKFVKDDGSTCFSQKLTLDGSKKDLNAAIDRLCEYTGIKIVFIDLKEPFIDNLYIPSVSQSRLETLTDPLDMALSELCGIIVEPLRDHVVTSLLQACVDGIVRVLLDGGPSRVFSPSDAGMLEEDIEILHEFFISEGEGLPSDVVENLVARAQHIVKLQRYESRELIDDLKSIDGSGKSKLEADANTLLRILCHRNEPDTSLFLKKQYKIPSSAG